MALTDALKLPIPELTETADGPDAFSDLANAVEDWAYDRILPAGVTRYLPHYWGPLASFPTTGIKAGDTFRHTALGGAMLEAIVDGGGAGNWRLLLPGEVAGKAARDALSADLTLRAVFPPGFRVREADTGRTLEWSVPLSIWHIVSGQKPYFLAHPKSGDVAQPISGGWQEIFVPGEEIDTDGAFNPVAGNIPVSSRFVAPLTGYYRASGQVVFVAVAAGTIARAASLGTNGRDRWGAGLNLYATGVGPVLGSTEAAYYANGTVNLVVPVTARRVWLQAGEFVSMWGYSNANTSALAWNTTDPGQMTFFEVEYDGI